MSRRIRSELLKLRTTRTTLGLLLGLLALVLFAVLVQLITSSVGTEGAPRIDDSDTQRALFSSAASAALFSVLLGVLSVTNEFRHGTIRPTLLFAPARELLIAAKGIACAVAGALFGVLAVVAAFAVVLVWFAADGTTRLLDDTELVKIGAGCIAVAVLWGAIGVGVGATIRNQVGAVVGTIVWTLVPEPLLQGLVPRIGKFTPGAAGDALSGATGADQLSALGGLAVLAGWTALFLVAGAVLTARRDVP